MKFTDSYISISCETDKFVYTFLVFNHNVDIHSAADYSVVKQACNYGHIEYKHIVFAYFRNRFSDIITIEDAYNAYSGMVSAYLKHCFKYGVTPSDNDIICATFVYHNGGVMHDSFKNTVIHIAAAKAAGFQYLTPDDRMRILIAPTKSGRDLIKFATVLEMNASREKMMNFYTKEERLMNHFDTKRSFNYGQTCVKYLRDLCERYNK